MRSNVARALLPTEGETLCAWPFPARSSRSIDEPNQLAQVDVAGVRRTVNIGLLDADADGGAARVTGS